ncbi:MAG: DNA mismatch repair protein MutS [Bdellovibrionaceae bacterium]|nr:DNA mismatch repair protein MutS [Pseudobdellovibrionaceae bacterium]
MTPLMKQYYQIKNQHKDKILFFRMGDFFEMFDKDAEIAAPILNIALTCRNKKAGSKTKMCGIPHHSISTPISKLLAEGLHVAICDQINSATHSSGLVKRAVTRVLSPGMVYDLDTLDSLTANYLGAFDKNHISFLDLSTGVAFYYEFSSLGEFFKLLNQFQPKELVLSSSQKEKISLSAFSFLNLTVFDKVFSKDSPQAFKKYSSYPKSVQRLIYYVYLMQGEESLKVVNSFEKRNLSKEMYYSSRLYSHLEIFKNYEGSTKDTLFSAINRTKTPNGARLLKKRLKSPLIDKQEIEKRWDQIDWWILKTDLLSAVRKVLFKQGDGERKLAKIAQVNCNARDILDLGFWLDLGFEIEKLLKKESYPLNNHEELNRVYLLRDKIKHVINPDSPISLKEGGFINKAVNPQLDEWISLAKDSRTLLLNMEKKEQEELKIPSLKIRYNSVFGYYIEVRKIYSAKIPERYKRKQTLTQAERYTTDELYQLEQKILSAHSKQVEKEFEIFKDLRDEILEILNLLFKFCARWTEVDLYSSLAFLAIENNYTRPVFCDHFKLKASRHPVLEQKTFHEFVPNSLDLASHQTIILTGPNMAGKSTLMRQFALTILLSQCGCFVPATRAEIPLFHKMFTRMGASDFLSKGLSTFMVEMKETAEILEQADSKSFIILDELGRGTATFDGMSLAQAILEYLTVEKQALLFSATHYQELTQLADKYPAVKNVSMLIREEAKGIKFLYLLQNGSAKKSYGIPVARLAGLPSSILKRSEELLHQHEFKSYIMQKTDQNKVPNKHELKLQNNKQILVLKSLMREISEYPLMTQSPISAMNEIQKWKKTLNNLELFQIETLTDTQFSNDSEQQTLKEILN